jgi:hypothetical protein
MALAAAVPAVATASPHAKRMYTHLIDCAEEEHRQALGEGALVGANLEEDGCKGQ